MKFLNKIHQQQSGEILILSLIILLLSGIVVVPLMHAMNTGIKTTQVYQRNTQEIYAADSGIQYGMWMIRNNTLVKNQTYTYPTYPTLPLVVNNNNVTV